jgi:seryl-tRNA synthetase
MLDIQFIRDHADEVKEAAQKKQIDPEIVDQLIKIDHDRRKLIVEVEDIRAAKNKLTRDDREEGKRLKVRLKEVEPQLRDLEEKFQDLMIRIPNPPAHDVPVGADESGNKVVKTWGEKVEQTFNLLPHHELAKNNDWYDSERAVRIAGSRAYFLKGDLVLLEQALLQYSLKKMTDDGFTPMTVPWMVNRDALVGTGYFPWGEDDHYKTQDGQGLIGTAEVSLTAYHKGETLSHKDLPIKICGISPCFRREVGSYGKDTQGFFRVHQFTKVEMVVYTVADEDITREWHDKMLGISESLLQDLKLPYQVLLMCTGDMGAGQRRKYDIETWFPSQNKYRETHSDSYFNDFQARRLNIRYQTEQGDKKYVYTLNNTVAASPRLLAGIIENYQQADGSVKVPEVLQPYMGKNVISGRKK